MYLITNEQPNHLKKTRPWLPLCYSSEFRGIADAAATTSLEILGTYQYVVPPVTDAHFQECSFYKVLYSMANPGRNNKLVPCVGRQNRVHCLDKVRGVTPIDFSSYVAKNEFTLEPPLNIYDCTDYFFREECLTAIG